MGDKRSSEQELNNVGQFLSSTLSRLTHCRDITTQAAYHKKSLKLCVLIASVTVKITCRSTNVLGCFIDLLKPINIVRVHATDTEANLFGEQ